MHWWVWSILCGLTNALVGVVYSLWTNLCMVGVVYSLWTNYTLVGVVYSLDYLCTGGCGLFSVD